MPDFSKSHPITQAASHKANTIALACAALSLAAIVIVTGWTCDDAYITARYIDNFLSGYGLRFNVVERVQGFTHPLWLLFCLPFFLISSEPTISFQLAALTAGAITTWIFAKRLASSPLWGLVIVQIGLLSVSLSDFSTSGLETPLSFGLIAASLWMQKDHTAKLRTATGLAIPVGLLLVTRQDLALLVGPMMLWAAFQERRLKPLLIAAIPLTLWSAFSLFYYGSLVPNTAWAKLNTGFPREWHLEHGLKYLQASAEHDPALALLILVGIGLAAHRRLFDVVAGAVLYAAYVVWIGGDFMAGRFLTPIAILALAVMAWQLEPPGKGLAAGALALSAVLGILAWHRYSLQQNWDMPDHGVVHERKFYWPDTSFVNNAMALAEGKPYGMYIKFEGYRGRELAEKSTIGFLTSKAISIGMLGYYGGPRIHLIDEVGLTEPFLARLPALKGDLRVGHYLRPVPRDYEESIHYGPILGQAPRINSAKLQALLTDVTLATRSPLLSEGRLGAIWRLNTGWRYY